MSCPYQNYYLHQVGSGWSPYSGAVYQRGHGVGGILAGIGKAVFPLLKTGAKTVGKQLLQSGARFVGDVVSGQNVKKAAKKRTREAGTKLLNLMQNKVFAPPGERPHKRARKSTKRRISKKQTKDIFD